MCMARLVVAGTPDRMQSLYGLAGERRLDEYELPHLKGYGDSRPVRVGNAGARQLQLDVFGEVLDSSYQARRYGLPLENDVWNMELLLARHLAAMWRQPDEGIWEVRGGRRHFTWSKIMAWVGLDRVVRTIEEAGLPGPIEQLRRTREEIRAEVETSGFDRELNSFVQSFGSKEVDATLLLIPSVGFLRCDDPRVRGTVSQIEKRLLHDGLVARYDSMGGVDGLPGREGVFCPAAFGSLTATYYRAGTTKPGDCSRGSSRFATMSACYRKSTTRSASGFSEIFRRRFLTWPW
jgi:GH15 family glucan-1,4-alpha-glucosidase